MTQLWNTTKTTLFLGLLTGFFMMVGGLIGGTSGMFFALILAGAMNIGVWWFSDRLVLRMSGARPVSEQEEPDLHRLLSLLAQQARIPKPSLYIIESDTPNAFATGRSPAKGAVAVTSGIRRVLTREELAGVIAHEVAHIKNRDTLISTVAATFAGAISMIADMAFWGMLFGGSDDEEGGIAGGLATMILAPIAALMIQMAISRSREYAADAEGARLLGTPLPLASALESLEAAVKRQPMEVNPAVASLYIVNPMMGDGMLSLFRTHPETEKRVAALRAMTVQLNQKPALVV
jgi:heat shock protein HtpX